MSRCGLYANRGGRARDQRHANHLSGPRLCRRRQSRPAPFRDGRRTCRAADRHQGPDHGGGCAYHLWHARLCRFRAGDKRSACDTAGEPRRHRRWQDKHAGNGGRWQHFQRCVRRHAESLEHGIECRRVIRRRGRLACHRRGLAQPRLRSWRQPSHTGLLLRCSRVAAKPGPRRQRQPGRFHHRGCAGADGALGARLRAVPRRHGRVQPRSADILSRPGGRQFRRCGHAGIAKAEDRVLTGFQRNGESRPRNSGTSSQGAGPNGASRCQD